MRSRLTAEHADLLDRTAQRERPLLELALCVHYGVESVLEKTRLSRSTPPDHVHAMGRGPLAAGGSYYYADLVVEGLRLGGGDPSRCQRALDFGCSSGRVERVLAAAYPDIDWHGCDPNEPAIEWAQGNLEGISFGSSPSLPPLPYPDAYFDLVFAISIWSHFSDRAATRWLAEMGRVIRPGGVLVLTAHGYHSVAHFARSGLMAGQELDQAVEGMYARGFWFGKGWFWESGDHGLQDPDWGMSFLSTEWMLMQACSDWSVVGFEPARAESNQDLYVLRRHEGSRNGPNA